MKAMLLEKQKTFSTDAKPLILKDIPIPEINKDEVLIKISACGVCHTDLDIIEGRIILNKLPVILGHQVVGKISESKSNKFKKDDRVGIGWIYSSCEKCYYCLNGQENLCKDFKATGKDENGGYAEYMKAKEYFIYKIPDSITDIEAAPLLCAGGVGYRSIKFANIKEGQSIGLTGFGASGHLVLKLVKSIYNNVKVYVFARSKDQQEYALSLKADWAGDTESHSPIKLNSIIDTTPVWKPVVEALKNLAPGGRLIINAIKKENIDKESLLKLDYEKDLWLEKEIKSVANVTRNDLEGFIKLAAEFEIKPEVSVFKLEEANEALMQLKFGNNKGAIVIGL